MRRGTNICMVREPDVICPLGTAWSGNSVNCTPYRQHGLLSHAGVQYGAFYDADGAVCGFRRRLGEKTAETSRISGLERPHDAHFSPSLGIDSAGFLHVMGGAHVSRPYHFVGAADGRSFSLEEMGPEASDTLSEITYPSFLSSDTGDLYLLFRVGRPGRAGWRVRRWRPDCRAWDEDSFPLLSGFGSGTWPMGPYINTPLTESGGTFGFFVVWRSESLEGSRQRVFNIGIDYLEADLSRAALFSHSGAALPTPVTPSVAERVIAVPWMSDLSNQSGATRLKDGRPFGVAMWRAGMERRQIHAFWPDARGIWQSRPLSAFRLDSRLDGRGTLYLPHSRPACAVLEDGTVAVVYRTAEAGGMLVCHLLRPPGFSPDREESYILWPEDLGFYEPVIDCALAATDGTLSLYLQRCGASADGSSDDATKAADAFVAEWKLP